MLVGGFSRITTPHRPPPPTGGRSLIREIIGAAQREAKAVKTSIDRTSFKLCGPIPRPPKVWPVKGETRVSRFNEQRRKLPHPNPQLELEKKSTISYRQLGSAAGGSFLIAPATSPSHLYRPSILYSSSYFCPPGEAYSISHLEPPSGFIYRDDIKPPRRVLASPGHRYSAPFVLNGSGQTKKRWSTTANNYLWTVEGQRRISRPVEQLGW